MTILRSKNDFWSHLSSRKHEIEAVISFYLGVERCEVAEEVSWMFGSYNVCIPVCVDLSSDACIIVRIPLPLKFGEAERPGNVDEKL